MFLDRAAEKGALDRVLGAVREGLSGVFVLLGEAGVGKSTLLDYAVASAADMDVVRAAGVESEMELGFSTLHQLLAQFMGRLDQLPAPQREALSSAFGLAAAAPPDVFLVGLATLTLLADAASQRPVLCVIDDAQWVDQASARALGFVARRLFADRVGMLFATRDEPGRPASLDGLPELRVNGLPESSARELLASLGPGHLDPQVSEQVLSEARGNPLALVELATELSGGAFSGGTPLNYPLAIDKRLEERFLSRVRSLPADTQMLLLLAAAQELGDPALLWRAAGHLGIGPQAAYLPELERLLTVEPQVGFRHPLMRSAVYQGASSHARRRAHEALAAATDPGLDPERRAWHRAEATVGPDEDVAAELERAAGRAGQRGGLAGQAAFLERAAELSTDDVSRSRRLVAAAEGHSFAGAPQRALMLLDRAARSADGLLEQANLLRMRARTTFYLGETVEAVSLFVHAALAYEPVDIRAARDMVLEALGYCYWAGPAAMHDAAMAGKALPRLPEPETTAMDLLMDGFADLYLGDWLAAAPPLHEAIARARAGELSRWEAPGGERITPWAAWWAAMHLCDLEAWRALVSRGMESFRRRGMLTSLAATLDNLGVLEGYCGRFDRAEACLAEAHDVMVAIGAPKPVRTTFTEVVLLAYGGREAKARDAVARLGETSTTRGEGNRVASAARAELCVLDLGLGNYEQAFAAAQVVFAADPPFIGIKALPDVVEAACRAGEEEAATAALARLQQRARASGTPWALGLLARSRALLADDAETDELFGEALAQLTRAAATVDVARAHLLYGEWLRRQHRRSDASDQLRTAHQMFDTMGAEAFAERARTELLSTGEHVRERTVATHGGLTPQEDRVARLAAYGATNREIAARLFISPSTVDYHLRKVFLKLNVTNRTQLARRLTVSAWPSVRV
jgi:DNA-binding CsgD family transcriptional regulator/tetratricopeptide (TPR) repeat protein